MKLSTAETNVSLTKYLETAKSNNIFIINDDKWIHYLQDSREFLEENSERITLTEEMMGRYQYRISDYLRLVHKYPFDGKQAFMVVNRLHGDQDFTYELGYIFLPDRNAVRQLRDQFVMDQAGEKRIKLETSLVRN